MSPQVHTDPFVGTGQRLTLLTALAAQEGILPKIFRQQKAPIHVYILEAACKGRAAQLDRAEPGRWRGCGSCRSWGHRAGGHAELGRAALVPKLKLQDPLVECHLHSVPVVIIQGQVWQPQN